MCFPLSFSSVVFRDCAHCRLSVQMSIEASFLRRKNGVLYFYFFVKKNLVNFRGKRHLVSKPVFFYYKNRKYMLDLNFFYINLSELFFNTHMNSYHMWECVCAPAAKSWLWHVEAINRQKRRPTERHEKRISTFCTELLENRKHNCHCSFYSYSLVAFWHLRDSLKDKVKAHCAYYKMCTLTVPFFFYFMERVIKVSSEPSYFFPIFYNYGG